MLQVHGVCQVKQGAISSVRPLAGAVHQAQDAQAPHQCAQHSAQFRAFYPPSLLLDLERTEIAQADRAYWLRQALYQPVGLRNGRLADSRNCLSETWSDPRLAVADYFPVVRGPATSRSRSTSAAAGQRLSVKGADRQRPAAGSLAAWTLPYTSDMPGADTGFSSEGYGESAREQRNSPRSFISVLGANSVG